MIPTSGILSKTNDGHTRFLTSEQSFLIKGSLPYGDGFHASIDLSNVELTLEKVEFNVIQGTFAHGNRVLEAGDCKDCACDRESDDCSTPNDCDCDCAPSN